MLISPCHCRASSGVSSLLSPMLHLKCLSSPLTRLECWKALAYYMCWSNLLCKSARERQRRIVIMSKSRVIWQAGDNLSRWQSLYKHIVLNGTLSGFGVPPNDQLQFRFCALHNTGSRGHI